MTCRKARRRVIGRRHAQHDPADIALVDDVRRDELDDRGQPQPGGGLGGGLLAGDLGMRNDRDAVLVQQRQRLGLAPRPTGAGHSALQVGRRRRTPVVVATPVRPPDRMSGRFDDVVEAGHGQRDAELVQVAHGAGLDRRNRLVEQHDRRAGPLSAGASIRSRAFITSPRSSVGCTWIAATSATSGSSARAEIESRKSSGFADAAPVDVERVAQACRTRAGRCASSLRRRLGEHGEADSGGVVLGRRPGRRRRRTSTRRRGRPRSSGPVRDNRPAVVTSCSRDRTRMTPSCRSAASTSRSSPTSAPVWLRAISAASALEPILSATIGLPSSAARCASDRNRPRRGSTR